MVVTNGSVTKHLKEIRDTFTPQERAHIFFKFSFHYIELKRLDLMDQYFQNVRMMREAGCSFTCELTPYDRLIPHIDEIKAVVKKELGSLCHITIARDDRTNGIDHLSHLNWKEYQKVWGAFDSKLFDFKKSIFYRERKEFCYAGDWTLWVNLSTGDYQPCNCGAVLGNIYREGPLHLEAIGRCRQPHCYNGHSWIVLDAIPRFTDVTYADERDRVTDSGEHWLTEEFRDVFSSKLSVSNQEYSAYRKMRIYSIGELRHILHSIKHKVTRFIKRL